MGKTKGDVDTYSMTIVTVFGILGNILIIISILKQRRLLRSNYYVLVLQLAICDLGVLIFFLWDVIVWYWAKKLFHPVVFCVYGNLFYVFRPAGVGMMLVISLLRYRATVHPLKPAIGRQKLKVVCCLVYIASFIVGCGIRLPLCFVWLNYYDSSGFLFVAVVYHLFPTIFMAVVYYKVGRALFKQGKHMKRLCHAEAVRKRYIRDRRIFFICFTTVFCYGIGNVPITLWYIVLFAVEYHSIQLPVWWFYIVSAVLQVACSNAANPVIYGILDKQLRTIWKCRKPNTRRLQEPFAQQVVNHADVEVHAFHLRRSIET